MENVKVSTNAEQQHESKVNEAENFDTFMKAMVQVMAYRCTRLCSSQSQRGSIWRMSIRLSKNNPVFATQRKTGERIFKPLHLFAHSKRLCVV